MLGDGGSRNKKANIYSRRTDGGEKMDRSDRLSPSHLLFLLAISLGPSAVIHLCALLGLLDTVHVLFGQVGAVKRLLSILSVALEHLGLQLSAHGRRKSGSYMSLGFGSCLVIQFSTLLVVIKVLLL